MKIVAVILAGGSGVRFGSSRPKQFLRVAGKLIIEHTLDMFQKSVHVDEIAVVTHAGYVDEITELVAKGGYTKVCRILRGGATRSESSLSAIGAYWADEERNEVRLMFHDAVRPFVTERVLGDVREALLSYDAVDVAVASTDTILEVQNRIITHIPDRSRLMNSQTPQTFLLPVIKKAYDLAALDADFVATDDCGVVRRFLPQVRQYVVLGEVTNIKITHQLDLFLAERIVQLRREEFLREE